MNNNTTKNHTRKVSGLEEVIIIIFITYTPGTNKHTHEKNKKI